MPSNRLAFFALVVACVGAAAGGGYLASRQNAVPAPASAQVQTPLAGTPATPAEATAPSSAALTAERPSQPVQETEAVVAETASKIPALSGGPESKTIVARRVEPPARSTSATREIRPAARKEQPPTLTSSWPSGTATQSPAVPSAPTPATVDNTTPTPRPDERAAQETPRAPEPPQKTFEELVVSSDSVIGLQTENRISSETARVEDRVEARVTRDVKVGDRVAIPAGARAIGSVMQVERGGKFKERARLGIRFHTLVLADGTRLPMSTETIYRDGDAPGNSSAAKVGGAAVGGAILGAILGGAKGAAIGGTAGAGAGTAVVMAGDRSAATLPAGTAMTVRLLSPVTVTTEK
jgi:hypothetical protein